MSKRVRSKYVRQRVYETVNELGLRAWTRRDCDGDTVKYTRRWYMCTSV